MDSASTTTRDSICIRFSSKQRTTTTTTTTTITTVQSPARKRKSPPPRGIRIFEIFIHEIDGRGVNSTIRGWSDPRETRSVYLLMGGEQSECFSLATIDAFWLLGFRWVDGWVDGIITFWLLNYAALRAPDYVFSLHFSFFSFIKCTQPIAIYSYLWHYLP